MMNPSFQQAMRYTWSLVWRILLATVVLSMLYSLWRIASNGAPNERAIAFCNYRMEESLNAAVQRKGMLTVYEHEKLSRWLPNGKASGVSLENAKQFGSVKGKDGATNVLFFSPLGGVMSFSAQQARDRGLLVYPYAPNTVVADVASWDEEVRRSVSLAVFPVWTVNGSVDEEGTTKCGYRADSTFANPLWMAFRGILSMGGSSREVDATVYWVNGEITNSEIEGEDILTQTIAALSQRSTRSQETVEYVVNAGSVLRLQKMIQDEVKALPDAGVRRSPFLFESFDVVLPDTRVANKFDPDRISNEEWNVYPMETSQGPARFFYPRDGEGTVYVKLLPSGPTMTLGEFHKKEKQ